MKLNKVTELPDSVQARHILIAYAGATRAGDQVTRNGFEAQSLSDSLYKVIKEDPAQFEAISQQYSDDIVAKSKGGDLGWFGDRQMAEPFSNYCFRHKVGDIGYVQTEFGFHIIIVDDQKGAHKAVRIARMSRRFVQVRQR